MLIRFGLIFTVIDNEWLDILYSIAQWLQWRNWLAHGTYTTVHGHAGVASSSLAWSRYFGSFDMSWVISEDPSNTTYSAPVAQLVSARYLYDSTWACRVASSSLAWSSYFVSFDFSWAI